MSAKNLLAHTLSPKNQMQTLVYASSKGIGYFSQQKSNNTEFYP
jgi:hypothetical protein